ncbi:Agamous-like MADS-box protein [Melia azedarach]|uniref:Agamous-like MADS-box protein n=1 Tax=Melia azedarach TaxID=155640 RepID=A0ACC1WX68_MELAZ|nr:Agamous-like MADS-box protein [Melia azedarach]
MGRRKIEMKMVKDSNSRQVTFSKRRNGLFKKANELATLCAAQVAIVVFSPGGKPFSFGHPSVDSVAQRFLNQYSEQNPAEAYNYVDPRQQARVEKLSQQLTDLLQELHVEKKRGEALDRDIKANAMFRNKNSIDDLNLDELLKMKASLEVLRENLKGRVNEMEASASLLLLKQGTGEDDDDDQ